MNEDNQDIILEDTSGGYTENGNNVLCAYDGERYHEDEMNYSDVDDCYYHEENSIYIDERDTYVNIDEATYNSYSGNYHYSHDLE